MTQNFTISRAVKINYSEIYNKETGKKIKKQDFFKLIQKNPRLFIEPVIGANGEIIKHFVDLSNQNNPRLHTRKNKPLKNELFPNFIAKTTHNKIIELNKLKGKVVILRFELEANNFRFKKHEIQEIDNLINKIENKNDKIKAVIFFASNKSEVEKGFDLKNSNFEPIPNSNNFHEKYAITRFPTTIVIDKNGKLVDYYKFVDEINLNEILSK
ncbi:peroxiredoxin family protein [Tenacibaculum piscium]|nr:redoxin domain-containing protein [Tenacibaculum piscium]MCG8182828.1 redoxin domain-containing protein [Tenacibaculum piscium]MCG8204220.1 redoxin domain-containing protein [Tenacibaculum piscium]